jgi:hypothetical protein
MPVVVDPDEEVTLPTPPAASCSSTPWTSPPWGFITDKTGQTRRRILRKTGQLMATASVAYCFVKCGVWYAAASFQSDWMDITLPGIYGLTWVTNGNQHGGTISRIPQSLSSPRYSADTYWDFSLGSSGLAGSVDSDVEGWTTIPLGSYADEFAALTAAIADPANWSSVTYMVTGAWSVQATAWEVFGDGFRGTTSGWREFPAQNVCTRVVIESVDAVNSATLGSVDFYWLTSQLIGHSVQSGGGVTFSSTPDLCQGCDGQAIESYPTGTDGGSGLLINPGLDNNSVLTGLSGAWGTASWGVLECFGASGATTPSGATTRTVTLESSHWPHWHAEFKLSQREIPTCAASASIDAVLVPNGEYGAATNYLPDPSSVTVTANDATMTVDMGGSGMWVSAGAEGTPSRVETGGKRPHLRWYVRHTGEPAPTRSRDYGPSWSVRAFPKWNAIKLTEGLERTIEGSSWSVGSSGFDVWITGAAATVSVASGALRIVNSGGVFGNTGLMYSTKPYLEDRYIRVRYRSTGVANATFRLCLLGVVLAPWEASVVTITSVDYPAQTTTLRTDADGTWIEAEIDLLAIGGSTLATTLNRWSDTPLVTGWRIDTMSITGTQAIEIAWIKAGRKGQSRVSALSPAPSAYYTGSYAASYPEVAAWHKSNVSAFSGGMLSLAPATTPTSPSVLPFVWGSIGQLADVVNRTTMRTYSNETNVSSESATIRRWTGWSITDLAAPRVGKPTSTTGGSASPGTTTLPWAYDDLFDSDAPSWCLGGDGLLLTSGTFAHELDVDTDATLGATLRAQRTIHDIRLYPGMGDGGAQGTAPGAYGDTTPVWVQAVWAGQAVGCIVGAEEGESTAVQEYLENVGSGMALKSTTTDRGSLTALTGADGFAAGDTPLRGRSIRVAPGGGGTLDVPWTRKWGNRLPDGSPNYEGQYGADPGIGGHAGIPAIEPLPRQRWTLRVLGGGAPSIDNLNPTASWFMLAGVDAKRIRLSRWEYPVPTSGSPLDTALVTSPTGSERDRHPHLWEDAMGRLYLLFWRQGPTPGAYEQVSDDNGLTWSTPTMSIPSGQWPQAAVDISGGVLRAAWVQTSGTTGNLKGTWQGAGETSASAVFTLTDTTPTALSVKNTGFSLSPAPSGGSELLLTCTIAGESATSNWKSTDDGRTWTRI